MLEMEAVQYKGFRNLYENGEAVGFQVGIRFVAYRGPWLSQFRFKHVKVDDEVFGADVCTFVVGGIEYTYDEMASLNRVKWPLKEAVYVRVKKPGGLAQGSHKVQVIFWEIASYIPERMDEMSGEMHNEDPAYNREMIIV